MDWLLDDRDSVMKELNYTQFYSDFKFSHKKVTASSNLLVFH